MTGLDGPLIARLLALEEDQRLDAADAVTLYPAYLELVQDLVKVIDAWRVEAPQA